jgi:hypothetical protein
MNDTSLFHQDNEAYSHHSKCHHQSEIKQQDIPKGLFLQHKKDTQGYGYG